MNNPLRVIVVDPTAQTRGAVKKILSDLEGVSLEAEYSRYECFGEGASKLAPDVGIMAIDEDSVAALNIVQQIIAHSPQCCIVATSSSSDGDLILRFMRAGVSEFLAAPVLPEELSQVLKYVAEGRLRLRDNPHRRCRMIAVVGSAGGVGTTSLAVNLGCQLASEPQHSVALIDLDLNLGDSDVCLDTIAELTLIDLVEAIDRLDQRLIRRWLVQHATGLYLLSRPLPLCSCSEIEPDKLQRFIDLLAETFSHLIFDLSKAYTAVDRMVLSRADQVLLVTHLDPSSLRNALRILNFFDGLTGSPEKVRVVINQVGLNEQPLSVKQAEAIIGREIYWEIPYDRQAMTEVRSSGRPLLEQVPQAAITQNIAHLAETLVGRYAAVAAPLGQRSRNPVSEMRY